MGATIGGAKRQQSTDKKDKPYELVEPGMYPGRCIQVIELGTHVTHYEGKAKNRSQLMLTFELSELMEDGRPFVVSWIGTNSLYKSKLLDLLNNWRGKNLTEEEAENFSTSVLLDKCCQVNVVHETYQKDGKAKTIAQVKAVTPLGKGMACIDRVNDLIDFGIHQIGTSVYDKLYPWVKTAFIEKSLEYAAYLIEKAKQETNPEDPDRPF